MSTNQRNDLVAPCGIDCGTCELYLCKDNGKLLEYLLSKGIPSDKLPCAGCRANQGNCPVIGNQCATYACVVGKEVNFCFQCNEFPCSKLNPSADRAGVLPHNMKVFNLCSIQRKGVEGFIEISTEIKGRYYKGTMEIGKGPRIVE